DSDLSIHIFSPEADDLAERQFKIACESGKPALVVTRNPEEPRRHQPDTSPAIYLPDPNAMRLLIELVNGHLGRRDSVRRVLLLYMPDQDWRHADDLTQMLSDHGADVFPPPGLPIPDPYYGLDAYVDDLRRSAGVVVCWGKASDAWLDTVEQN